MNEDQVLVQKVWRQLESEMLQELMDSIEAKRDLHDLIQQLKHEGRS